MRERTGIHITLIWFHKTCAIMMCSVFLLSSAMTGSYAWFHLENAINSFFGGSQNYSVILEKYEKDINGNETELPIEGAIFDLYYIEETSPSAGVTEYIPMLIEEGLKTNESGRIQIEELDQGEYFFLETSPSYCYTYDMDEDGKAVRKYYFSINNQTADRDQTVKVTAYNQRLTGQLNITKSVELWNGEELSDDQKDMRFEFYVSFGIEGEYSYSLTSIEGEDVSEPQKLTDGKLKLKHGQMAVFENLPAGMYYSVIETPADGYEIRSNDHRNEIPPITERPEGITAEFINIYSNPEVETAPLIISKSVTRESDDNQGEADIENQEFIFRVDIGEDLETEYQYYIVGQEDDSEEEWDKGELLTIHSGDTLTLRHGEQAMFEEIPVGTSWEVEELELEELKQNGYSATVSLVSGTILDTKDSDYENRADFINHWKKVPEEKERTGELLISKEVLSSRDNIEDETGIDTEQDFTFQITFSDGESYSYFRNGSGEPIAATDGLFTLKHGEHVLFKDIPEGVTWKVTETAEEGYTSSVSSMSGTIIHDVTGRAGFVNYQNKIDPEEPLDDGELLISKVITGDISEEDKGTVFTFTVKFGDGNSYPYYIDSGDTLYQMTDNQIFLKGGEVASFPELPAGLTYTVTELSDSSSGFTASITEVSGSISEGGQAAASFVNHKENPEEEMTGDLKVSKAVIGAAVELEDTFTFSVTFSDGKTYPYTIAGNKHGADNYPLEDGTFILKAGEHAVFEGIPEGVLYMVEEVDYGSNYTSGLTRQQGMIVNGQTAHAAFLNGQIETTELLIKKIVVPSSKEDEIDTEREFYFTLKVTVAGTETIEEFILCHGEEISFVIPKGARYNLIEKSDKDYIQTSVTNGYGTADRQKIEIIKTNTKKTITIDPPDPEETIRISAEKVWNNDGEDVRPEYIQIQLYKNGQPFGTVIRMSKETNWSHAWVGLSDTYEWTVDEIAIPENYKKTISGSQENGYTITNTYLKYYPGDNGGGTEPGDKDGNGNNNNGGGNGSTGNSSGGNGTTGNSDANGTKPVKTGDDMNIRFWAILMVVSAIVTRRILLKDPRFKMK